MEYTHIIQSIPSNELEHLFRASDGMLIGEVSQCTVIFGESPRTKDSRLFIDHESAKKHLRRLADEDAFGAKACIDERCLEGAVVLAPNSVELRANGGSFPNIKGFNKSLKQ